MYKRQTDGRAKLVLPTDLGNQVIEVAQGLAPEIEQRISALLGTERMSALRTDLETLRRGVTDREA